MRLAPLAIPLLVASLALSAAAQDPSPLPAWRPVPWTQVRFIDRIFRPWQELIRDKTHAHSRQKLEAANACALVDLAAHVHDPDFVRPSWNRPSWSDHDLFKLMESMAYTLGTDPSPARDAEFDALVARYGAAMQPDGYLNTWYTVFAPEARFKDLGGGHELYCAGHLFEAAVAHHQATGKHNLLDLARRYADMLCVAFGSGKDAIPGYAGHPEIELALVRLWQETGEARYFELARLMVERRGSKYFARERNEAPDRYDGSYCQDQAPLRQQTKIVGHAVRAGYLWAGVTDVAGVLGDQGLLDADRRVYANTIDRRMFVTGGIGASGSNEGFTEDFDLPTTTAYQETCASIAGALWSERLARLYGDARYFDTFELALYNAVLAGFDLDGCHFNYVNPLGSDGGHHRSEWFDCACCPNNVTRTIAGLGRFVAATAADTLAVNLYVAGEFHAEVAGQPVRVEVAGDYPWDGALRFLVHVADGTRFRLLLRLPQWCAAPRLAVAGAPATAPQPERGYAVVDRQWRDGDVVQLELPMAVRRLAADPRAVALRGQAALMRGPLVYCVEQCDHDVPVAELALPAETQLTAQFVPDLLGGVTVLQGQVEAIGEEVWPGGLYRELPAPRPAALRAIPYFRWDHRQRGAMRVWLPTGAMPARLLGLEQHAQLSLSYRSPWSAVEAIRDGLDPRASRAHPGRLCHFWPHAGAFPDDRRQDENLMRTPEWIDYAFATPQRVAAARVYWFYDGGGCKLPAAARLLYRRGGDWQPVPGANLALALDRWCETEFPPLEVDALRLEITLPEGAAVGVHEWNVFGADR